MGKEIFKVIENENGCYEIYLNGEKQEKVKSLWEREVERLREDIRKELNKQK